MIAIERVPCRQGAVWSSELCLPAYPKPIARSSLPRPALPLQVSSNEAGWLAAIHTVRGPASHTVLGVPLPPPIAQPPLPPQNPSSRFQVRVSVRPCNTCRWCTAWGATLASRPSTWTPDQRCGGPGVAGQSATVAPPGGGCSREYKGWLAAALHAHWIRWTGSLAQTC